MSDVPVNNLDPTRPGTLATGWGVRIPVGPLPTLSLNPSTVVVTTAKAVARGGSLAGLPATMLESELLLELLVCRPRTALRWLGAYPAAQPHLRTFLTQSVGLALTVEYARAYGWDARRRLINVDALTAHWQWLHRPGRLPRPDFVFSTPLGLMAAEARGRSTKSGWTRRDREPETDQTVRCDQIEGWAAWALPAALAAGHTAAAGRSGTMAWFMCYARVSQHDARIDVFDPGTPLVLTPEARTAWEQAHRALSSDRYRAGLAEGGLGVSLLGEDCVLVDRIVRPLTDEDGHPVLQIVAAQTPGVFVAEPGPDDPPRPPNSETTVGGRRVVDWTITPDLVVAVVEIGADPLPRDEQISLLSALLAARPPADRGPAPTPR